MKKKTKHIIIIILSIVIWIILFFIPTHNILLNTIIVVVQLSLVWFGWHKSFKALEKINAATKLLDLIEQSKNNGNTYAGICGLINDEDQNNFYKNVKYKQLLKPTEEQRLKFGNQALNKSYWFEPNNWETRIKYLKSYL